MYDMIYHTPWPSKWSVHSWTSMFIIQSTRILIPVDLQKGPGKMSWTEID